jgi:hypothetical protein
MGEDLCQLAIHPLEVNIDNICRTQKITQKSTNNSINKWSNELNRHSPIETQMGN